MIESINDSERSLEATLMVIVKIKRTAKGDSLELRPSGETEMN